MTLHQTRNMASDADFQFIMGTVFGQKQDSQLFKALEKAGITNVGGITSLTDQAININRLSTIKMTLPEHLLTKS
jgi:hypothetical protein